MMIGRVMSAVEICRCDGSGEGEYKKARKSGNKRSESREVGSERGAHSAEDEELT